MPDQPDNHPSLHPPDSLPGPLAGAEPVKASIISPLTVGEVVHIATELQGFVGAQLQDCMQSGSDMGLSFYHEGEAQWLWFDLHPLRPLVIRVKGKPPSRKKIQRPLTLFLKSRFVGRRLASVHADLAQGRVLVFRFHRSKEEDETQLPELEVRLFPHGQNIIARDGKKSISETKPKDLPPSVSPSASDDSEIRSWQQIEDLWRSHQQGKGPASGGQAPTNAAKEANMLERAWKKAIDKKEKAIERMKLDLDVKTSSDFSELGEWLKSQTTNDMKAVAHVEAFPEELTPEKRRHWLELLDLEQSLSWNIENCFRKSKDNLRKSAGTRARIELVEQEVSELRRKGPGSFSKKQDEADRGRTQNLLSKAVAKGRRHQVAPDLEAYIGKSAADNLALLRRAQSFDYWLHLRDFPGSHAILRRTRNRIVTDHEFYEVGRWVAEQSLGKRSAELKGERLDLLIVECRFVRPIKGDRLGRANYTNDRVLTLKF